MPSGSIYTYIGNADASNNTGAIQTSQGVVVLGSYGYFTPAEHANAVGMGLLLAAGQVGPAAPSPVTSNASYAVLGSDGYVGTPGSGGSQLSPSVVTNTSGAPTAGQVPVFTGVGNQTAPGAGGGGGSQGEEGPVGQTGPTGATGPTGPTGEEGPRGTEWFVYTGTGTPAANAFSAAAQHDLCLRTDGEVFTFNGAVWADTDVNLSAVLSIGSTVSQASASSLLVTDPNSKLASGPSAAAVAALLVQSSTNLLALNDIGFQRPEWFGAKGDGVILYNTLMTANSPVLTSTDTGVNFTEADVDKTILVSGVGPGNESLVTTIASVQSASSITLATNATVDSPDPATLRLVVYGTDDTVAIQEASDAAAITNGTLKLDSKVYIINGALKQGGARLANAQITLPNTHKGGIAKLVWEGARDATGNPFSPFPTAVGTVLVSTLINQVYSSEYGIPSVIGGPTREQSSTFSGLAFTYQDMTVLTPRNPSLSCDNLERCSAHNRFRVTAGTLEWGYPQLASFGGDVLAIAAPSNPWAAAFIDPMAGNQQAGSGSSDNVFTWGYFAGLVPAEHSTGDALTFQLTRVPIAYRVSPYQSTHHSKFGKMCVQCSPYVVSGWDPTKTTSAAAIVPVPVPTNLGGNGLIIDSLDVEDYSDTNSGAPWAVLVTHFNDANNGLCGRVRYSRWSYVKPVGGGAGTNFTYEPSLYGIPANMVVESNTGRPDSYVVGRATKDAAANTAQNFVQGAWTAIDTAAMGITFKAPPQGWVEIEISFTYYLNGTSPYALLVGCVDQNGNYVPGTGDPITESETAVVVRKASMKRFVFGLTYGEVVTWNAAYYLPNAGNTGGIVYGGAGNSGQTAYPSGQMRFVVRALGNSTFSG
jgi:hypothetical protein